MTQGDLLNVSTSDGKYTVIQSASGAVRILRYGEPWRDDVLDKALLALAYEVEELRAALHRDVADTSEMARAVLAGERRIEDVLRQLGPKV